MEMNTADIRAAMDRMLPDELELLKQLTREGEPREALVLLELFHHFPGIRLQEAEKGEEAPAAPRKPIDPKTMEIPF